MLLLLSWRLRQDVRVDVHRDGLDLKPYAQACRRLLHGSVRERGEDAGRPGDQQQCLRGLESTAAA